MPKMKYYDEASGQWVTLDAKNAEAITDGTNTITPTNVKNIDKKIDDHIADGTKHITSAERTKLSSVANNANNYVHPVNHPASIITQDANNKFVTNAQIAGWDAKETASGAQTKADKALQDAKVWARSFGLGENLVVLANIGQADSIVTNGLYCVILNTPVDNSLWFVYQHIKVKDNEHKQIRYNQDSFVHHRTFTGNAWTQWYQMMDDVDTDRAVTSAVAVVDNKIGILNNELTSLNDIVVNVSSFGAKGDGVTDDTVAVLAAVNSFLSDPKKNVLHFPGEKYIITQKLPIITKDILITGVSETGTEIEYRASANGAFIENSSTWKFQMKNMYLRIVRQSTEVKVGGIELYRGSRSSWGKVAELENVRVEGYTTFGVKIYAPFMSNFKKVHTLGHLELIKNPSNPKLPHPDIQCLGFDLVGYESGIIDTFGNVNTFENCWFSNNKYGVRLVSVANTLFKGCTFEPNFINLYATSPTFNSNSGNIVVENSWFEDYTGACHPTLGAYITYKFDEATGDLVMPLSELARVTLENTTVHPSCAIDKRMNGGFLYSARQAFSYKTFAELDSENVIYKEVGNIDGHYMKLGTKENYIRNLTKFERGQAILASNNVSGYEETSLYYYNITNPNTDKSNLYTFEIPIVVNYGSWVEFQIDALIVAGGGNPIVCRAYLYSTSVSDSTVLSDPQLLATEIDANNKGLKLTYNNTTGKVTVSIQASVSTKTNLNVKYIKRMAM